MVEPHQSCVTENAYFGSALQNSGCIFHGHEKGATYRVWNPGAHGDGLWDRVSCRERDCGVTIDIFHGNVISTLSNSEKGEYWELPGKDWKLGHCHGTAWGTQHQEEGVEVHSSALKKTAYAAEVAQWRASLKWMLFMASVKRSEFATGQKLRGTTPKAYKKK